MAKSGLNQALASVLVLAVLCDWLRDWQSRQQLCRGASLVCSRFLIGHEQRAACFRLLCVPSRNHLSKSGSDAVQAELPAAWKTRSHLQPHADVGVLLLAAHTLFLRAVCFHDKSNAATQKAANETWGRVTRLQKQRQPSAAVRAANRLVLGASLVILMQFLASRSKMIPSSSYLMCNICTFAVSGQALCG